MEKYGLLFESIFKRKLTDEGAAGYLKNITKEHPYFSVAQFYLLRLSQKNINGYKDQARKTAVLFNNNHWLNFQLLEAGFDNSSSAETLAAPLSFPEKIADDAVASKIEHIAQEEKPAETYSTAQPWYDAVVEEVQPADLVKEITIEEEIKTEESGAEEPVVINEPVIVGENNTIDEVLNDETVEADVEQNEPADLVEEINTEENDAGEPAGMNALLVAGEENTVEEIISDETASDEDALKTVEAVEERIITTEDVVVDEPGTAEDMPAAPLPVENIDKVAAPGDTAAVENTAIPDEPANEITPGMAPVSQQAVPDEIPGATEEKQSEEVSAAPVVAEKAAEPEPLLFEPLHTSDYFASVGIKLSEEEKTSGNLGKQLKSFTDWLKTMKKVHAEQLVKTSSPMEVSLSATESSIQKMAEKSNQENDVITEAMSDVLLQQGKADKAVEILEKLSLLNPGKSAYFAAKINQIKDK